MYQNRTLEIHLHDPRREIKKETFYAFECKCGLITDAEGNELSESHLNDENYHYAIIMRLCVDCEMEENKFNNF